MRVRILNLALKSLFPIFQVENVLSFKKDGVYLGEKKIDEKLLDRLKADARMYHNTELWKIMSETLMQDAQIRMFNNATDFQDMLNGKMVLYTIDIQQKMIEKLRAMK